MHGDDDACIDNDGQFPVPLDVLVADGRQDQEKDKQDGVENGGSIRRGHYEESEKRELGAVNNGQVYEVPEKGCQLDVDSV